MPQSASKLFKLTLSLEEAKGLYFLSSPTQEDIFIAVTSRDEIRRAVDTCLRNVFGQNGQQVRVYMNCQLQGPTVEAVVELV